ncbi:phage/plasmid primase, P4 family [Gottfriedia acidiceleris]|uniref:phage/plasmid primase, P4 family n=1 Tax=Gottfriedia acidiceleris TaxID=371036 RepID=UPI002FFE8DA7
MEFGHVREMVNEILPDAQLIQLNGFAKGNTDYSLAKVTHQKGYTKEDFQGLTDKQADLKVMQDHWIGTVIPKGYIVVDCDNAREGEKVYKILSDQDVAFNAIRTPNGYQFVFSHNGDQFKQAVKWYTTLGITIDTRNAHQGYIVFPTENVKGRIILKRAERELDEIPHYLIPRKQADQIRDNDTGFTDMFTLHEGSRDILMTKWRGRFWSWNMKADEYTESMKLIWKYFIDDKDTFPESQMDKHINKGMEFIPATRDALKGQVSDIINKGDWWTITNRGTEKFLHYIMADYIKQKFHIVRYGDESGMVYYYDLNEGYYKLDANLVLLDGVIRTLDKTLTTNQVKEVINSIVNVSNIITQWSRDYIPMKNGLWDIKERKLITFSSDIYVNYKIDINWNPLASSEFIDETLDKITSHHLPSRLNLEECLGAIISPELLSPFVWFLYGRSAHNGKSFYQFLIQQLVGINNVSTVSPHDFNGNKFTTSQLYEKKVNLVDEVGENRIPQFNKIKELVTGGIMTIEFKGKGGFSAKVEVPQVWASNYFPNVSEEGDQVDRRLYIIPFDYNFKDDPSRMEDYVAQRMASTEESREYLLKLAIDGMNRIIDNNSTPTFNEKAEGEKAEFKVNNDKLADWLDTVPGFVGGEGIFAYIDYTSGNDVYNDYIRFCQSNNDNYPLGKTKFKNELMKRFNLQWTKKRLIDTRTGKEEGNPQARFVKK